MAGLTEKIGYIRGLVGSMDLDPESPDAKLYKAILDVMEAMANELSDMHEDLNELNDFVESIDEDLEDLESMHDSEEENLEFSDDEDGEDFEGSFPPEEGLRVLSANRAEAKGEDALVGSICPECEKLFFVPLEGSGAPEARYSCPHCEKQVPLNPIGPDNAPIARRADREKDS